MNVRLFFPLLLSQPSRLKIFVFRPVLLTRNLQLPPPSGFPVEEIAYVSNAGPGGFSYENKNLTLKGDQSGRG